ncbi:AI-2E family transporter [Mycoplasmatota bacterium]|nr:AI-2E family transporter [Mycoplasmatota bacterium]
MNGYKKTLSIIGIVIGVLLSFYLLNLLNATYPQNIISRIINGIHIVLVPVLIALMITYLMNPFTIRMINHKVPKWLAVVITMVISIGLIVGLIVFIIAFMIEEGANIYESIMTSNIISVIETWANQNNLDSVYDYVYQTIYNYDYTLLVGSFGNIIIAVFQGITTIVLVPIFLWFFLNEKDRIFTALNKMLPNKWQGHFEYIGAESNQAVVAYFKSKLISMLLLFIVFSGIFICFNIPIGYAIFFAFVLAAFDLVPYLGPILGLLLPIVYFFSEGSVRLLWIDSFTVNAFWASLILLILNMVIQFVQNNIVIPKLAGEAMNINPLLILVAMLFFGSILGVWGIIFAIPLCGIGVILVDYLKTENKKEKQSSKKNPVIEKK